MPARSSNSVSPRPAGAATTAAAAGTRKLTRAHFAFMRGLSQGLPLRETWDRYLQDEGKATDMRVSTASKDSLIWSSRRVAL